ncbi:hypothetical protein NL676_001159 [Syzygium grande]|nr:hypothetical protein NL676_001159 [Syzygium grande]
MENSVPSFSSSSTHENYRSCTPAQIQSILAEKVRGGQASATNCGAIGRERGGARASRAISPFVERIRGRVKSPSSARNEAAGISHRYARGNRGEKDCYPSNL